MPSMNGIIRSRMTRSKAPPESCVSAAVKYENNVNLLDKILKDKHLSEYKQITIGCWDYEKNHTDR